MRKNLLQIHTAVLLFGLAGLFGKWMVQPAVIIVLGRVFFATLFLTAVLLWQKQSIRLHARRDGLVLLLMGVILAAHWVSFFQSIQVSTVAIGLLTVSTFPLFVTFLEPAFFHEPLHRRHVALALITLGGVALVIPNFDLSNNLTQGALWGIFSGFTFAILSLLNRRYVARYPSQVMAWYQDGTAVLVLLPFYFLLRPTFTAQDVGLLLLLGVLFTAVAHVLFISGLATVKAQTASIIASLEPVYGIFMAALFLDEIPSTRTLLGGAIILATTLYASTRPA